MRKQKYDVNIFAQSKKGRDIDILDSCCLSRKLEEEEKEKK